MGINRLTRRTVACFGMLALAGCAAGQLENAEKVSPPVDSAYQFALHQGYMHLAREASKNGDQAKSDLFAGRAIAVTSDDDLAPLKIAGRRLSADKVRLMAAARSRLVRAQDQLRTRSYSDTGATVRAEAGRAQVTFDCWMMEQEKAPKSTGTTACRKEFEAALTKVEQALQPRIAADGKPVTFVVYFTSDETGLDIAAKAVVAEAAAVAEIMGKARISVVGNADRPGVDEQIRMLSLLRANTVAKAMVGRGAQEKAIEVVPFAKTAPSASTADENGAPQITRVEILIRP